MFKHLGRIIFTNKKQPVFFPKKSILNIRRFSGDSPVWVPRYLIDPTVMEALSPAGVERRWWNHCSEKWSDGMMWHHVYLQRFFCFKGI